LCRIAFRGDKTDSHCHGEISFRPKTAMPELGLRICNVPQSSMILYGSTTASPARLSFAKGRADRIPVYGGRRMNLVRSQVLQQKYYAPCCF
jgi:hypothetical protein